MQASSTSSPAPRLDQLHSYYMMSYTSTDTILDASDSAVYATASRAFVGHYSTNPPRIEKGDESRSGNEHAGSGTQEAIRELLHRCGYAPPKSAVDGELRRTLIDQVAKWNIDLPANFLEKAINASCIYVETVYGHTPSQHRQYIALYTACMLYADDLGEHDPSAVMQFTRRFVRGDPQPNDVFECLAGLLKQAHELWPQFGADSIVTGTLDALAANHIECTTREMAVKPLATRYPTYLRLRAGIGAPFTHFVFPNNWRETPESYIQILPEIDHWTLGANDILSFYKEELAGETNNYIHLRAAAEQASTDSILYQLVNEVSDTARRVNAVVADDLELLTLWNNYMQRYLEFHLKTPRYRLAELGFSA